MQGNDKHSRGTAFATKGNQNHTAVNADYVCQRGVRHGKTEQILGCVKGCVGLNWKQQKESRVISMKQLGFQLVSLFVWEDTFVCKAERQ